MTSLAKRRQTSQGWNTERCHPTYECHNVHFSLDTRTHQKTNKLGVAKPLGQWTNGKNMPIFSYIYKKKTADSKILLQLFV